MMLLLKCRLWVWRGWNGRGQREDESFVVLGFNELENTIALS